MKLRVVGVLSALLALLVVVVSLVLMQAASRSATQQLQLNRLDSLNRFVELAVEAEAEDDSDRLETEMRSYSQLFGEGIVVRRGGGVLSSGGLDPDEPRVAEALRNAGLNLALTELPTINPLERGSELIARPFGNSSQVLGAVVLEVDPSAARAQVLQRWLAVVGSAVIAGVLLVALAWWVTSWVLRPIHRLNTAVLDFAATGTPRRLSEGGPPELRQLQRSFSSMSAVVTESLEQQRELIAETSHQLRNPLAALRLRVDLLKLNLGERAPQNFDAVERELENLETLLEGVLRLASAEHRASEQAARGAVGELAGAAQVADLAEVLDEQIERIAPRARAAGSTVRFASRPTGELRLRCNGFELAQMVAELLENAVKYAPGTAVEVSLQACDGVVLIAVQDHGRGLEAAELAQAGTRFWRSAAHRRVKGTGLGLAIVARLAEANGGSLILEPADGGRLCATLRFASDGAGR